MGQRTCKLPFLPFAAVCLLFAVLSTHAQSAPVVYQGRLSIAGVPANGSYDMQFKLFDTAVVSTGAQQGDTVAAPVPVTNGIFTVTLDFGASAFTGTERYLEIGVKLAGTTSAYNTLAPRQQITSVPYAIHSLSAAQLDGRPASSFIQADDNGNVGIGTLAPPPDIKLHVTGNTRIIPNGGIGYLQVGTPNGETGLSVLGKNRFDLRFNDKTLTLAANPGLGPPNAHNGLSMNTNGNVGIGMDSPLADSQWKLEINGPTRISASFDESAVEFSKPNGETGMSIRNGGRADVRFNGSALKLVAGAGLGPPPAENGIAIRTSGKVGIGTTFPEAKLHVEETEDLDPAIYGRATARYGRGVIGSVTGKDAIGVFGIASEKGSIALWGHNPGGVAIHAEGNATQAPDNGGFVKAMIYVNGDSSIARCYNGVTVGASILKDCGFSVKRKVSSGHDRYRIDFGFQVNDRFLSVTPRAGSNLGATFEFASTPNQVDVDIFLTDVDYDFSYASADFMIIVY